MGKARRKNRRTRARKAGVRRSTRNFIKKVLAAGKVFGVAVVANWIAGGLPPLRSLLRSDQDLRIAAGGRHQARGGAKLTVQPPEAPRRGRPVHFTASRQHGIRGGGEPRLEF